MASSGRIFSLLGRADAAAAAPAPPFASKVRKEISQSVFQAVLEQEILTAQRLLISIDECSREDAHALNNELRYNP